MSDSKVAVSPGEPDTSKKKQPHLRGNNPGIRENGSRKSHLNIE